jgi:hypothetical protein
MSQIRDPFNNVRPAINRGRGVDIHEYQKKQIYKQGQGDQSPGYSFSLGTSDTVAPTNDTVGIEDTYLYFDSGARDSSSLVSVGELKYSINNLNFQQPVDNCIEIQIGSFYFPMVNNPAGSPLFYFFRRVYMQITTLPSTQGVLGPNTSQYHFEFDVSTVTSIATLLNPVKETLYFRQPIITQTDIIFKFFVPNGYGSLTPISLPKDRIFATAIAGSNPGRFVIIGGDTIVNMEQPAPVVFPVAPVVPIAIFIRNFNSADNTLNNAVNVTTGLFVTNFPTNDTTFEVATLNFTTLAVNTPCAIWIGKNRIAFQLRFTTLRNSKTNFLEPIHV